MQSITDNINNCVIGNIHNTALRQNGVHTLTKPEGGLSRPGEMTVLCRTWHAHSEGEGNNNRALLLQGVALPLAYAHARLNGAHIYILFAIFLWIVIDPSPHILP